MPSRDELMNLYHKFRFNRTELAKHLKITKGALKKLTNTYFGEMELPRPAEHKILKRELM